VPSTALWQSGSCQPNCQEARPAGSTTKVIGSDCEVVPDQVPARSVAVSPGDGPSFASVPDPSEAQQSRSPLEASPAPLASTPGVPGLAADPSGPPASEPGLESDGAHAIPAARNSNAAKGLPRRVVDPTPFGELNAISP
jgi:hypothetical protein